MRLTFICLIALLSCSVVANGQSGGAESPRAARIKASVNEILRSPDFQSLRPENNLIQRFGKWMVETLDRFWNWVRRLFNLGGGPGTAGGNLAGMVLFGILVIAMAAIIAYVIRRWGGGLLPARLPGPAVGAMTGIDDPGSLDPATWLAEAARTR